MPPPGVGRGHGARGREGRGHERGVSGRHGGVSRGHWHATCLWLRGYVRGGPGPVRGWHAGCSSRGVSAAVRPPASRPTPRISGLAEIGHAGGGARRPEISTMSTTTTPAFATPESKAEARVLALRERAERAASKARERVAKAEAALTDLATRDARTERAKAIVRAVVEAESARRRCLCGCGIETPRAFFVPGHDARLLSVTIRELAGEATEEPNAE